MSSRCPRAVSSATALLGAWGRVRSRTSALRQRMSAMSGCRRKANKRAPGKGGIVAPFHTGRAWPALPDRERWTADRMTTTNKRLLFIGLDLSGLLLAWAMFGTRYF